MKDCHPWWYPGLPRMCNFLFCIRIIYLSFLAKFRLVAADDEYSLFSVVIFKRVRDEFLQRSRENQWVPNSQLYYLPILLLKRFIVREFTFSEEQLVKQRQELDIANTAEKELWVCIGNIR